MNKPRENHGPPLRLLRSCAIEACRFTAHGRCDLCGISMCFAHGERVAIAELDLPASMRWGVPRHWRISLCIVCRETLRAHALQERALQAARRHWIIQTTGAPIYDLHLYRHYRCALWPRRVRI